MDAQRAIEAPRFLVGRDPADPGGSRMQIEDRFPRSVLENLTARGHRFQKIGRKGEVRYGYAAAAVVDVERRQVQGGAEPQTVPCGVAVGPAFDDAVEPLSPSYFLSTSATSAMSARGETAYRCAPSDRVPSACARSSARAYAVSATPESRSQRRSARSSRTKSNPVACGIAMSVMTTSGRCASIAAIASRTDATPVTSAPAR